MSAKLSFIIILACVSLANAATFGRFIEDRPADSLPDIINHGSDELGKVSPSRLLQATSNNDKLVSAAMTKIVADSNSIRASKGLPLLTVNNNVLQIVHQWAQVLRLSMPLTQYLQLYGIQNVQIENYTSIPAAYVAQVVQKLSTALVSSPYNQVAPYYNSISADNYEVLIVLQGGSASNTVSYHQQQVQSVINSINTNQPGNSSAVAEQSKPVNVISQSNVAVVNSSVSTATTSSSYISTSSQSVQVSLQVNQQPVKPIQTTAQVTISSSNSTSTSNAFNSSNTSNVSSVFNSSNSSSTTTVQVSSTQTTVQSIAVPQSVAQTTKYKPSQPLSNQSLPALPLVTQTSFNPTTSFPNITLSHAIPTTFLKNQLFPFRGTLNVANPTGIQVNVIFTRVTDQQRLAFRQYLTSNVIAFSVVAYLNLTGDFYLSIFLGRTGVSDDTIYTITSDSFAQPVSRVPSPPAASLNLVSNTLWLNWTSTDSSQPCITQIIFTQQGGKSAQFIISNYQTQFKVPYQQFASFNAGTTNIQITQAFSSDQSAYARTSAFSGPYNIIFNATTHHYHIITTGSSFSPVPFKVAAGASVSIVGTANTQLENEIILLTPSKQFQSVYINGNASTTYIQQGTPINSIVRFNQTGVYILQVNNGAGEAVINMPIYVGDIYPLLPDFMDLNPTYIDLPALNEPRLLQDRRNLVLQLINKVRSSFGVNTLYLDDSLNQLAQDYSQNQIQYNYVGHVDMNGRSPGQRAQAAGIFQGVGENLAMNNNLTNAQLMLERSNVHLRNMVNPIWTRVGLGILQNSNQFYYLTQEFSSRDLKKYPLTQAQILTISATVVDYIVAQYPNIRGEDKGLSSRLTAYQQMTNRPYILSYLSNLGYKNIAVSNVMVSYNNGDFMPLVKSGGNLEPTSSAFSQVGITVAYSAGMLEMFAAYI